MITLGKNTAEYWDAKEFEDENELDGYELAGANTKFYNEITKRIIAAMRAGNSPWNSGVTARSLGAATNIQSKKFYQGVNILTLGTTSFDSFWWGTKKQIESMGGKLKKKALKNSIVFWRMQKYHDPKKDELVNIPLLKNYIIYNLDDTTGLEKKFPSKLKKYKFKPIALADKVSKDYAKKEKVKIYHDVKTGNPHYSIDSHNVHLHPKTAYKERDQYYSVLFHELGHSTGKKLKRKFGIKTGSTESIKKYAFEELVAQFTAAFVCSFCGIDSTYNNDSAYLKSWAKELKANPWWCVSAAGKAQKASDLILGKYKEEYHDAILDEIKNRKEQLKKDSTKKKSKPKPKAKKKPKAKRKPAKKKTKQPVKSVQKKSKGKVVPTKKTPKKPAKKKKPAKSDRFDAKQVIKAYRYCYKDFKDYSNKAFIAEIKKIKNKVWKELTGEKAPYDELIKKLIIKCKKRTKTKPKPAAKKKAPKKKTTTKKKPVTKTKRSKFIADGKKVKLKNKYAIVPRRDFQEFLNILRLCIVRDPSTPILNFIKIELKNGIVKLSTCGSEDFVEWKVKAKEYTDNGISVIDGKEFKTEYPKIAKGLGKKEDVVKIELGDIEKDVPLKITVNDDWFTFPLYDPDETPIRNKELYDKRLEIVTDYEELKESIAYVKEFVSPEKTRFAIDGILFETKRKKLNIVGTNGHALCIAKQKYQGNQLPDNIIVSVKFCAYFERKYKLFENPIISFPQSNMTVLSYRCLSSKVEFFSRLTAGVYPNYNAVLPNRKELTKKLNINKFKKVVNENEFDRLKKVNYYAKLANHKYLSINGNYYDAIEKLGFEEFYYNPKNFDAIKERKDNKYKDECDDAKKYDREKPKKPVYDYFYDEAIYSEKGRMVLLVMPREETEKEDKEHAFKKQLGFMNMKTKKTEKNKVKKREYIIKKGYKGKPRIKQTVKNTKYKGSEAKKLNNSIGDLKLLPKFKTDAKAKLYINGIASALKGEPVKELEKKLVDHMRNAGKIYRELNRKKSKEGRDKRRKSGSCAVIKIARINFENPEEARKFANRCIAHAKAFQKVLMKKSPKNESLKLSKQFLPMR